MAVQVKLSGTKQLSNTSLTSIVEFTNFNFGLITSAVQDFLRSINYVEGEDAVSVEISSIDADIVQIKQKLSVLGTQLQNGSAEEVIQLLPSGSVISKNVLADDVLQGLRLRLRVFGEVPPTGVPGEVIYVQEQPGYIEGFYGYLISRGWVCLSCGDNGTGGNNDCCCNKENIVYTNSTEVSGDGAEMTETLSLGLVPATGTGFMLFVNGQQIDVGNGTAIAPVYLSNDEGATAISFYEANTSSRFYWNESYAGFALDTIDRLTLRYIAVDPDCGATTTTTSSTTTTSTSSTTTTTAAPTTTTTTVFTTTTAQPCSNDTIVFVQDPAHPTMRVTFTGSPVGPFQVKFTDAYGGVHILTSLGNIIMPWVFDRSNPYYSSIPTVYGVYEFTEVSTGCVYTKYVGVPATSTTTTTAGTTTTTSTSSTTTTTSGETTSTTEAPCTCHTYEYTDLSGLAPTDSITYFACMSGGRNVLTLASASIFAGQQLTSWSQIQSLILCARCVPFSTASVPTYTPLAEILNCQDANGNNLHYQFNLFNTIVNSVSPVSLGLGYSISPCTEVYVEIDANNWAIGTVTDYDQYGDLHVIWTSVNGTGSSCDYTVYTVSREDAITGDVIGTCCNTNNPPIVVLDPAQTTTTSTSTSSTTTTTQVSTTTTIAPTTTTTTIDPCADYVINIIALDPGDPVNSPYIIDIGGRPGVTFTIQGNDANGGSLYLAGATPYNSGPLQLDVNTPLHVQVGDCILTYIFDQGSGTWLRNPGDVTTTTSTTTPINCTEANCAQITVKEANGRPAVVTYADCQGNIAQFSLEPFASNTFCYCTDGGWGATAGEVVVMGDPVVCTQQTTTTSSSTTAPVSYCTTVTVTPEDAALSLESALQFNYTDVNGIAQVAYITNTTTDNVVAYYCVREAFSLLIVTPEGTQAVTTSSYVVSDVTCSTDGECQNFTTTTSSSTTSSTSSSTTLSVANCTTVTVTPEDASQSPFSSVIFRYIDANDVEQSTLIQNSTQSNSVTYYCVKDILEFAIYTGEATNPPVNTSTYVVSNQPCTQDADCIPNNETTTTEATTTTTAATTTTTEATTTTTAATTTTSSSSTTTTTLCQTCSTYSILFTIPNGEAFEYTDCNTGAAAYARPVDFGYPGGWPTDVAIVLCSCSDPVMATPELTASTIVDLIQAGCDTTIKGLPQMYSNLRAWYEPSGYTYSDIAINNSWTDSSGNGHNLAGSTAAPAVVQPSLLNGISVPSGQNYYYRNTDNLLGMSSSLTMIFVASFTNDATGNWIIRGLGTGSGASQKSVGMLCDWGETGYLGWYGKDASGHTLSQYGAPFKGTGVHVVAAKYDAGTKTFSLYWDGNTYDFNEPTWDDSTVFSTNFQLGNMNGSTSVIAEVAIYGDSKSTTHINEICNQLANKYGLSWSNI